MGAKSGRVCGFLTAAALLAAGCGDDPLSPREQRELQAAEARWAQRGFSDYAFVTRRSCFCSPDMLRWSEISVLAGDVVAVRDVAADTLLSSDQLVFWYTVEDIFEAIHDAAGSESVDEVIVTFDPALGYPTLVRTVHDPSVADGGGSFEVTAVRPL